MEEKGAELGLTQQEEFQEEEKGRRALEADVCPELRPGGIRVCGVFRERVCGLVCLGHGVWKPQTAVRGILDACPHVVASSGLGSCTERLKEKAVASPSTGEPGRVMSQLPREVRDTCFNEVQQGKLLDASLYGDCKTGWPKQILDVRLSSSRCFMMGWGRRAEGEKLRE